MRRNTPVFRPLLLAPGVVVHEVSHLLACLVLGVRVQEFVPFRFGNPAGYVTHAVPRSYTKRIFISVAPLLVNTLVAIGAFWWSTQVSLFAFPFVVYLGVVVLLTSLPSAVDARSLLPHSRVGYVHPLFVLTVPVIGLLLLVNRLKRYRFDVAYTVVVSAVVLAVFHTDHLQWSDLVGLVL